jgi:ElaB/YqjD/DUF883 family membrane-anchored ribosome-binding protein
MTSATKTVEGDIQALRADIAALAESVGQMISGAGEAKQAARNGVEEGLNGAARAGRDFISDAGKLKSHSVHAAGEAASDATSLLSGEIKRNPLVAVAAALCVGFIAGIAQRR